MPIPEVGSPAELNARIDEWDLTKGGTRALLDHCLEILVRKPGATGLATALRVGALTADAVALEARKATEAAETDRVDGPASNGRAAATCCRIGREDHTTTEHRPRALTEQAAGAAVDQGCRMLRLPTIRAQFTDQAQPAARDQMSYLGFLAELLMAECDDRDRRRSERRIKAAAFPREKSLRSFDFDANPNVAPAVIHTLKTLEAPKRLKNHRVRYTLATKLVNELVEAADDKHLTKAFTDPRLCAAIVDRLTFDGTIVKTGIDSYRLARARSRTEAAAAG